MKFRLVPTIVKLAVALALLAGTSTVATPANSVAPAPVAAAVSDNGAFFCVTVGYNIYCGLDAKLRVKKGFFSANGDYCRTVKNTHKGRKGVALDIGTKRGKFHRVPAGKKRTICRAVPDGRVRVSLRVRMDAEVHRSAGTWLIAKDAAKRIVTKRIVPTKANPNVKFCAKNPMARKAVLHMQWGPDAITHTQKYIRPGKIGCVTSGLAGPGHTTAKFFYANESGVYWPLEAWEIWGY